MTGFPDLTGSGPSLEGPLPAALRGAVEMPDELRVSTGTAHTRDPLLAVPVATGDAESAVYVARVRSVLARVQSAGEARIRAAVARAPHEPAPGFPGPVTGPAWAERARARAHQLVDRATDTFVRGIS